MTEIDRAHSERVITSLLLMFFLLAGVALMREGAHFDNTADGERLFAYSLLGGGVAGFLGWKHYMGMPAKLTLTGPSRQLWLATALAALVSTAGASYLNRTFATLTDRSQVAAIDSVQEGKGARWHVIVSTADGAHERYLVTEQAAAKLKGAKSVRMRYARGFLGFDYIAEFEPVGP